MKKLSKIFALVILAVCVSVAAMMTGCKNDGGGTPVDKTKVTSISVTSGKDIAVELGKKFTIAYEVLPETAINKGVTFSSSDVAVASVNRNTGIVEGKMTGTAVITLKSIENASVTESVNVTVIDAVAKDENKRVIELMPEVYYSGEVRAEVGEGGISAANEGDSVVVYVKNATKKYSFVGKLDSKLMYKFDMSKTDISQVGNYDVEVVFPTNDAAKVGSIKFNDVAVTNYMLATENWLNGPDGKIEAPSTIGLKGDQAWGSVYKKFVVNNADRHILTVKTVSVTHQWSIKLAHEELGANDFSVGQWSDTTKEFTFDIASVNQFKDKVGDYEVIVKLFTISSTAADNPTVVIDTVTLHNGLKKDITAVKTDEYKKITAIGDISKQNLIMGKDVTVTPVLTPEDASFTQMVWTSADAAIVTVSPLGKLHPVAVGDTQITVTSLDGSITKTFDVNVRVAVTSITLTKEKAIVSVSDSTYDVSKFVSVMPENATNKVVTYSTDASSTVATVNADTGIVTLVSETLNNGADYINITVTSQDGAKKATFKLRIINGTVVNPEGLKITQPTSTEFYIPGLFALQATFTNEPTDPGIVWSSSDAKIARADAKNGNVRAVTEGVVTITATSNADASVKDSITIRVTSKYKYAFNPLAYDYVKLNFSSGSNITSIAKNDIITLTATSSDNTAKSTDITVSNASFIIVPIDKLGLTKAETYDFTVKVKRADALLGNYIFAGVELYSEGFDILSLNNWGAQDAVFNINDEGVATLSKGNLGWGHAKNTVTFNITKYPYLLINADVVPENMSYLVKLSNVGETDDPSLFSDVTTAGYYLVDMSKSTNAVITANKAKGDFDATFRLFFVGTNPNPIVFKDVRFLTPMEKALSVASSTSTNTIIAATDFTLKSETLKLNLLDAEALTGKIEVGTYTPSNASFKNLTYTVADPTVVSVSPRGEVTALKVGSTTITVQNIYNPALTKTVNVTVVSEKVSYKMTLDPATHGSVTVATQAADSTAVTLTVMDGDTQVAGSPFASTAQGGKVVFDISSVTSGEKEYTFIFEGAAADSMKAERNVHQYSLASGAQAGDDKHAIALLSDPVSTQLTFASGKYYNAGGAGWGQVSLKIKNFTYADYTSFSFNIAEVSVGTAYKIQMVVNNGATDADRLEIVGQGASTGVIHVAKTAKMNALIAKMAVENKDVEFRIFVIGNGDAQYVKLGDFVAYNTITAVKA